MNVLIITPPLVQLNAPYPSGAYLSSFFKSLGHKATWLDLSIELVREIFSRRGLEHLFALTEKKAMEKAKASESQGDEETARNLRRYVLQSELWISWIDDMMNILTDGNGTSSRETCHKFMFSPNVPRGARMENYIESLDREPNADDCRNLATMALADIADYITVVFDREFSLVRYAESLTVNETSFSEIEKSIDSPVLKEFYGRVLERTVGSLNIEENTLVCISVPFAGTFTSALFTGRWLKEKFGSRVFISFGGGFINTELREIKDKAFGKYADAISYDRGYGSYKNLLDLGIFDGNFSDPLYKMTLLNPEIKCAEHKNPGYEIFENQMTETIVPDYSDIDFSRYPRVADDTNPMQRLWSDGAWMKAYLAHGCYWHRCAFCDTTLDYVSSYKMTSIENLYKGLSSQLDEHKIRGIHFVDEAMPPKAMVKFADLALADRQNFSWWGNIRFEKVFTRDMADFMAAGGLIGVSGGIEIATGSGLDSISKGTDINSIVKACCAFKEAGILVHAYMIYGYFGETEQDTINSMETLRQLYAAGLLDSCFWHKFVLTRHSRIYSEWKEGKYPDLNPVEPKNAGIFAKNGLHFESENRLAKFGDGLNASLQAWMHGEKLSMSVNKWFDFKTPSPTISKDFIENAIALYEAERNSAWGKIPSLEKCRWLGGKIMRNGRRILWNYMQEEYSSKLPEGKDDIQKEFLDALECLKCEKFNPETMKNFLAKNPEYEKTLIKLRGSGLVEI
ncbi:radical SAM protein [Treponema sp.]|uniref:B12-binding domain-containing radical SAM protein n=1 Tax=Treponema sp. TaxID=166 RepID=UPI00298E76E9|nr:radical SAM protein [Treponema sp.]